MLVEDLIVSLEVFLFSEARVVCQHVALEKMYLPVVCYNLLPDQQQRTLWQCDTVKIDQHTASPLLTMSTIKLEASMFFVHYYMWRQIK